MKINIINIMNENSSRISHGRTCCMQEVLGPSVVSDPLGFLRLGIVLPQTLFSVVSSSFLILSMPACIFEWPQYNRDPSPKTTGTCSRAVKNSRLISLTTLPVVSLTSLLLLALSL